VLQIQETAMEDFYDVDDEISGVPPGILLNTTTVCEALNLNELA
jgi:hypothetical protein